MSRENLYSSLATHSLSININTHRHIWLNTFAITPPIIQFLTIIIISTIIPILIAPYDTLVFLYSFFYSVVCVHTFESSLILLLLLRRPVVCCLLSLSLSSPLLVCWFVGADLHVKFLAHLDIILFFHAFIHSFAVSPFLSFFGIIAEWLRCHWFVTADK